MRIALVGETAGGSGVSMTSLGDRLAADHEVSFFGYPARAEHPLDAETADLVFRRHIPLPNEMERTGRYAELYLRFRNAVRRFDPDLVCSYLQAAVLGARLGSTLDVPHLLFLHDESMLPAPTFGAHPTAALGWAFAHAERALLGYAFRRTDAVIANSEYTARRYREHWGIDPVVVYPYVDTSAYEVADTGEKILHVNPSLHKGIDVTKAVAERLPGTKFLLVGDPVDGSAAVATATGDLPNVERWGHVADMRRAYRETRLVLMPSRVETFGRVPVEAGSSGIPTIGAPTGGLPEAVGTDRLVVPENDPDAYTDRIRAVTDAYDEYATHARRNATEKAGESQYRRVEEVISAVC